MRTFRTTLVPVAMYPDRKVERQVCDFTCDLCGAIEKEAKYLPICYWCNRDICKDCLRKLNNDDQESLSGMEHWDWVQHTFCKDCWDLGETNLKSMNHHLKQAEQELKMWRLSCGNKINRT